MEKLPELTRATVTKMSNARLIVKLQQVGFTMEEIEAMDRPAMLNAWAEIILEGRDEPEVTVSASNNGDLERERFEFEKMKFEVERKRLEEVRMQEQLEKGD